MPSNDGGTLMRIDGLMHTNMKSDLLCQEGDSTDGCGGLLEKCIFGRTMDCSEIEHGVGMYVCQVQNYGCRATGA